ncbi:M48 family metalloprotease [Haloprofundus salilacus]|uniref:M48 family metalloprotease n=1 Tax=Haloprofundus salilacus TaxID=2876190 RepID=UPI001CCA35E5|nr:M48 family metalloprotease [Haloprofundus salilacus]
MRHIGLKVRMVVAGTVLFGFYAAFAGFLFQIGFGLPIVLAGSVLFVGVQYVVGKKIALWSVDAEEMSEAEYSEIHRAVEHLSEEMGITKPRLMVGQMGVPNAFAVGRCGAGVVVVSETLMDLLEQDELEGVLAHELAHIKNRDVVMLLIGQSVASMLGLTVYWVVVLFEDGIASIVLGWIASLIVELAVMVFVLAISRAREYAADSDAAEYTGNPEALARALSKLASVGRHERAPDVSDNMSALCIFGGKRGVLSSLFSTHPPMEKRIERLAPELSN